MLRGQNEEAACAVNNDTQMLKSRVSNCQTGFKVIPLYLRTPSIGKVKYRVNDRTFKVIDSMTSKTVEFLKAAFWPFGSRVNLTAVMCIGGFSLLALCTIGTRAWGWAPPDPLVIELGRASFYAGIGRASTKLD